jgi:uncharacterized protein
MKTYNDCIVEKINGDYIKIIAKEKTDFFIDGLNNYKKANAPFYYEEVDWNFELKICITPEFLKTYDAGGILVLENENKWIKAAFELTDLGYKSVVTVVTNEYSDDCNGEKIENKSIWIRIIRKDNYWAIHYSSDGIIWKMARYFSLNMEKKVSIGIIAQSPVGDGCVVNFKNLEIKENKYNNIRNGS